MFGGKTSDQWISEYTRSHQHRMNRFCHTIGIPLIVVSLLLFLVSLPFARFRIIAAVTFVVGWMLQFVGHAFERKAPEFFHDWRFLFVGLRWWFATFRGRVEKFRSD